MEKQKEEESNIINSQPMSPMHAEEEQIDFVGAVKLMDGVFLGDAICSDVINLI